MSKPDTNAEQGSALQPPPEHIQDTSPQDRRPSAGALDLNRASEAEIAEIAMIGKKLAHAIVQLRSTRGGFQDWEQLQQVPGLDAKRIAELQRAARLGDAS